MCELTRARKQTKSFTLANSRNAILPIIDYPIWSLIFFPIPSFMSSIMISIKFLIRFQYTLITL